MLDYDDFNSQHSTDSITILFEELCALVDYPPTLAQAVLKSFKDSEVYVSGQRAGRLAGTEFLRICSNASVAVGYLTRTISSTVSGSWTSAIQLGLDEWVNAMVRNIWNLTNRSYGNTTCALLLKTTVVRRSGLSDSIADMMCRGLVSVSGSPVRDVGTQAVRISWSQCKANRCDGPGLSGRTYVKVPELKSRRAALRSLPRHATQDYLDNSEDAYLLARIGIPRGRCVDLMLEASHGNLMSNAVDKVKKTTISTLPHTDARLSYAARTKVKQYTASANFGILCRLMSFQMTVHQIKSLGLASRRPVQELMQHANNLPIFANTPCTFSDGCVLAREGFAYKRTCSDLAVYV